MTNEEFVKDGLRYCPICGEPKQTRVEFMGQMTVVPVPCDCEKAERRRQAEESERAQRVSHIRELRYACFDDNAYRSVTFDSDTENCKCIEIAKRYVAKWDRLFEENIGLLFWGNTGTGKSHTAACIANALIDREVSVKLTSFPNILRRMQDRSFDANGYFDKLTGCDLLILDDLGAERQSQYALETVYSVVDARSRCHKPMIVTTNLTANEIRNAASMDYRRIYERIMEACVPVKFDGKNFREERGEKKISTLFAEIMGDGWTN